MRHPLRPQLVSGIGLRLIQGLGLLLDHLDGPALVTLGEEDAEQAVGAALADEDDQLQHPLALADAPS